MTVSNSLINQEISGRTMNLARIVLVTFLLTFMSARVVVFLIMSRTIPDLYLHLKGNHIHHLNYGIFLLSAVGAYLLFQRPEGRRLSVWAGVYGVGMALTFDEFGMWIHLGGDYWQRASWDAVVILTAFFGLIAFAPSLKRFRPHHWVTAIVLIITLAMFLLLFIESFKYAGQKLGPKFHLMESDAPK
jgi:thiol:disulfide interchange protein